MDLQPYVEAIRHDLGVAAAAGGADAEALADRLTAPLDSAIRLALLEALSEAAEQITRELAPGSVEVRLRGRDPEFTVTSGVEDLPDEPVLAPPESDDDGGTWRVTLRLPEKPAGAGRRGGPARRVVGERVARSARVAAALGGGRPALRAPTSTSLQRLGPLSRETPIRRKRCPHSRHLNPLRPLSRWWPARSGSSRPIATTPSSRSAPRPVARLRRPHSRAGAHRLPQRHACRFGWQTLHIVGPGRSGQHRHRATLAFPAEGISGLRRGSRRRRVRRVRNGIGQRRHDGGSCYRKAQGGHGIWRYRC